MHPEVSYSHTLSEIAVNRTDPCELVRELVSNAYDAKATHIRVYPLAEQRGVLFFDNGVGLSIHEEDRVKGVLPFQAFFSIGRGTKTRGAGYGYKCQGSKLCFASRRFTVLTRTNRDARWLYKIIDNPKKNLTEQYSVGPSQTDEPWTFLHEQVLSSDDSKTAAVLASLNQAFFEEFTSGTMLIVEGFETEDFETYFNTRHAVENYLFNYIRLHTAHGDCRRLTKKQGFSPRDRKAVEETIPDKTQRSLWLWMSAADKALPSLHVVPQGWPYLDCEDDEFEASPAQAKQLRSGRFFSRHATAFQYGGAFISVILAIDGARRALDGYPGLSRQSSRRSGLPFSETRGLLLSSHGIVFTRFPQLWNQPGLEDSPYAILADDPAHYTLIIDGTFELVTNRDALAPSAQQVLREPGFVQKLLQALKQFESAREGGVVFSELRQRLKRETTVHRENEYLENTNSLRDELVTREQFTVGGVPSLEHRTFFSPIPGEEHFVGALYTLFAHLVSTHTPAVESWPRPLTFASRGIDALAVVNDARPVTNGNVITVEYKHTFSVADRFNHPLNVTDTIVCWEIESAEVGQQLEDDYSHSAEVAELITVGASETIGVLLGNIRSSIELREFDRTVRVLSLKRLLQVSFGAKFRQPKAAPKPALAPRRASKKR